MRNNEQIIFEFLESEYKKNCRVDFIEHDPIAVPHLFSKKQDIEIAAFLTATIAWGNRKSILKSANQLMNLFDFAPHDFVLGATDSDLKRLVGFVHRTFNDTDLLYFILFLHQFYQKHSSLESAFLYNKGDERFSVKKALGHFHTQFFSIENFPERTQKHLATPVKKAACKRLNMFLRWMVRSSKEGVDFGLWKKISPSDLMVPLDVHVENVAKRIGLLHRKQRDWLAVEELTNSLRKFDASDPVKYDFALFGSGVMEKNKLK